MRIVTCFFVLFVCVSGVLSVFDYHARIGVPKAGQILQSEQSVLGRIVGGAQAAQNAYPYQAGIVVTLTSGWTSVCGGALISNTRVLSAAHCWWDGQAQARSFQVVLGSLTLFSGGTRIDTTNVVVHGSWKPPNLSFDLAMVKITSVTFSNSIQAIPLPATSDANRDFAGLTAIATGYGKTSDSQTTFPTTTSLHHVSLQVITNAVCQRSYQPDITIESSHLCTSGANRVGTCDGDSGGPLTALWNNKRILIGVVSFGPDDGCQAGVPSVFTRVTSYLTWIQANM